MSWNNFETLASRYHGRQSRKLGEIFILPVVTERHLGDGGSTVCGKEVPVGENRKVAKVSCRTMLPVEPMKYGSSSPSQGRFKGESVGQCTT